MESITSSHMPVKSISRDVPTICIDRTCSTPRCRRSDRLNPVAVTMTKRKPMALDGGGRRTKRPRRFKLKGRPKAAAASVWDREAMATGHGDGEESRRLAASKLMNQSIRIKFQDSEIAP